MIVREPISKSVLLVDVAPYSSALRSTKRGRSLRSVANLNAKSCVLLMILRIRDKLDMLAADAAIRAFLNLGANEMAFSPRTHSTSNSPMQMKPAGSLNCTL